MKIIQAIELFYMFAKTAFIPTRMAIPQINAALPKIIEAKGQEFAYRYFVLFENAFIEHDKLYQVISDTLGGKSRNFDKEAEEAMRVLLRLIDFILKNIVTDEIKKAQFEGRYSAVQKGYEEALQYYYKNFYGKKFTERNPAAAVAMSTKFQSTYHGLLEFALKNTLESFTKENIKTYQPFEY